MADLTNVRKSVIDTLSPLLPPSWRLYGYNAVPDESRAVVVTLTLQSVARHAPAPRSHRIVTYVLTVSDPRTDETKREDALDDDLFVLLEAIDASAQSMAWTNAERQISTDQNRVAYDITLQTIISNTKPTE